MSSLGTIKVGIVGLTPGRSWAARAHVPALQALQGYEIAGVASTTAQTAATAAATMGIGRAFESVDDLVHYPSVDLVAVTVKVPHHREIVDAALDAGKEVYCEWPLGRDLAEAEAMAARSRELGVRTAVGLQARSAPAIRYLRDLVRGGFVGDVLSTTLVGVAGSMGATELQHLVYLNSRANGANVLTIPFGHAIDALQWVLGDIVEVSATLATRRGTYEVAETGESLTRDIADQVAVTGVLSTGAVLAAHYRGGTTRGTSFRWEINGTDGDLVVTAPSGHPQAAPLEIHGGRDSQTGLSPMPVPASYRHVPVELSGPPVNVAEAYLRFAEGPDATEPIPGFDEAVRLHRLIDAVERSAAAGHRVVL